MPGQPDPSDIASAILRSAVDGGYPDQDIAGADLTSDHLPAVLEALRKAKEDVKEEVRNASKENATELDAWITQARRLEDDVAASKLQVDEILSLDEKEQALKQEQEDAEVQCRFLQAEIAFNENLASILGTLQLLGSTFSHVDSALANGQFEQAVDTLTAAESALGNMAGLDGIIAVELMKERMQILRNSLVEKVQEQWSALVKCDNDRVFIRRQAASNDSDEIIPALVALDLLNTKVDQLHQQLDRLLIGPRLETQRSKIPTITIEEETDGYSLRVIDHKNGLDAAGMFSDLLLIIRFLQDHLPPEVASKLARILIPNLTNRLISIRLSWSVPASLEDLPEFQNLLEETRAFESKLLEIKWMEQHESELGEWVDRAPRVWLTKRKELSLDTTRGALAEDIGAGGIETVEHTETQTVSSGDDWNEAWGDEEEHGQKADQKRTPSEPKPPQPTEPPSQLLEEDDDGADNWGLDEDLGFDDEELPVSKEEPPAPKQELDKPKDDNEDIDWSAWDDQGSTTKDVTLSETYTVTSVPSEILRSVAQILSEASQLSTNPSYAFISSASSGLRALPTLILAIYRALAPLHYTKDQSSNMYLYNDCMYLSAQLSSSDYPTPKDIAQITAFGKRYYGKEMEAQRTVLLDLLDDTQGFVSCTEYPHSTACDTAISSVAAQLLELHNSWSAVLSRTNLYQSVGSLLSTVITKIINDIEDLGDISEPESVKLVQYCEEIGEKLEPLFVGNENGPPVTALFCPGWLKFRYLAQILESSLRDIVGLYKDGCFVDFEKDELIGLIKALFADTDVRRRSIEEIRRS